MRAVGFTGSLTGGKALLDIINRRDDPIPFYGELSSVNPVIVTPGAAAERGRVIGSELVASFTLGAGQLCTKPGVVLIPDDADGDAIATAVRDAMADVAPQPLLNERIHQTYRDETTHLAHHDDVSTIGATIGRTGPGYVVEPVAFETDVSQLSGELISEIFGPVTVLVRYPAAHVEAGAATALSALPRSLTCLLYTSPSPRDRS